MTHHSLAHISERKDGDCVTLISACYLCDSLLVYEVSSNGRSSVLKCEGGHRWLTSDHMLKCRAIYVSRLKTLTWGWGITAIGALLISLYLALSDSFRASQAAAVIGVAFTLIALLILNRVFVITGEE